MSSFFSPGSTTETGQLALLHLSRDSSLPVVLSTAVLNAQDDGYAEGVVTNTKFGSFPHTTLVEVPWGSQVRASKVDTGSRGRREQHAGRKRKAEAISTNSPINPESPSVKQATAAESGFIHVLPPTPENWTTSLPHRTQVVYTPDYSYILHRIRARPGSVLLEAGSGSGSFTHAAARAVFDGKISRIEQSVNGNSKPALKSTGKVFTYEFHPVRHEKLQIEMEQHDLTPIVTATHRDVCKDGFLLEDENGIRSPNVNAVFLDLPAPWDALPHLSRVTEEGKPPVLDPSTTAYICTFSPCIEQVQKTISVLRRLGWLDIEMIEIQHKRLDVRRDFTGLKYEGMRGVNAMAADVNEAVNKLRDIEQRTQEFHGVKPTSDKRKKNQPQPNKQLDALKTIYKEGRIIHRTEPEIRTHTSYLVFALLPREWTDEDEAAAQAAIEQSSAVEGLKLPKSHRQMKKEAKSRKKQATDATKKINGIEEEASK